MPQYLLTSYDISSSDGRVEIHLGIVCSEYPTTGFIDGLRAFLEQISRESEDTRTSYQREIDRLSAPYFPEPKIPEPKKETPLPKKEEKTKESINSAFDRLEV